MVFLGRTDPHQGPARNGAALTKTRAVLPKTISPFHTTSRAKSAGLQTTKTDAGISEPARPDREPSPSLTHQRLRYHQKKQSETSVPDVVDDRGEHSDDGTNLPFLGEVKVTNRGAATWLPPCCSDAAGGVDTVLL